MPVIAKYNREGSISLRMDARAARDLKSILSRPAEWTAELEVTWEVRRAMFMALTRDDPHTEEDIVLTFTFSQAHRFRNLLLVYEYSAWNDIFRRLASQVAEELSRCIVEWYRSGQGT